MIIIEGTMFLFLIILSVMTVKSDLREGMIYNKTLLPFMILALLLDSIYYIFLVSDIFLDFLINTGIIILLCLFLFYTHSFAGGDCKLCIVMALLYPGRFYLIYAGSVYTLLFAVGFAIFFGYVYLLVSSVLKLIKRRNRMTIDYVKSYLLAFVYSFVSATIYISAINLLNYFLYCQGININFWFVRVLCIGVAWLVGKYKVLKKWYLLGSVAILDVILAVALKMMPISINPENYILVIVLLLCQMTIKTNLYEEIEVCNLKKGMILSTISSMMMQNSRVRGLPGISAEDLRNRLSEEEVSSVKRWAEGRDIVTISIVKKIPFAVFLAMGFACYVAIWGAFRWN